jgi:hypothetical protein
VIVTIVDGFIISRHPGESRGPVYFKSINIPGYRLSPV